MSETCFALTDTHIATLRKLPVLWNPLMESGMAVLDLSSMVPGGSFDPRLASLLLTWFMTKSRRDDLDASFAIFVATATLVPGPYPLQPRDVRDYNTGESMVSGDAFVVTADHLKLLANANAGWWEHAGSLVIDAKRPFGDMSYFEIDMARILGVPLARDAAQRPVIPAPVQARFDRLFRDLPFALCVLLRNGTIAAGTYCRDPSGPKAWRLRRAS